MGTYRCGSSYICSCFFMFRCSEIMDIKTSILRMIRQSSGYVSGQSLCEALGVSRTAVWKYVNQLKEEGYEFDAVSNKGYRIVKYPDIITREEIESMLPE